jgi:hypothetical protein
VTPAATATPVSPQEGSVADGPGDLTGAFNLINGIAYPVRVEVTLVAADPPGTTVSASAVDVFEVASDVGFSRVLGRVYEPQIGGGQTSARVTLAVASQFYWRVKATMIDGSGVFSAPVRFSTVASSSVPPLSADPPTLIRPEQGAVSGIRTIVSASAGNYTPLPGFVRFEFWDVHTQPGTGAPNTGICYAPIGPQSHGETRCTFVLQQGSTYNWNARVVLPSPTGDFLGQPSETRTLTIRTDEELLPPTASSPVPDATVHNRPALTVLNATRRGTFVGPLAYHFSVRWAYNSDNTVLAEGVVPEGPGQTSWTVPINLAAGVSYQWSAYAIDTATGVESLGSSARRFSVSTKNANLFALTISVPVSCSLFPFAAFEGTSTDSIGAASFSFATVESLSASIVNNGGALSGTIGGAFANVRVQATATDPSPAQATGFIDADGTMKGTFNGVVFAPGGSIGATIPCAAPDLGWRIAPIQ